MTAKFSFFKKVLYAGTICLCISTCSFSRTYSGIVKNSENGNPVKGVRVSLGYSNSVTTTDDNGNFILSYEDSTRKAQQVFSSEKVDLQFTGGDAVLNFFAAPSAKKIGLFSLNGKCVYQQTILPGNSVIKIPSVSKGIYILKIEHPLNIPATFSINPVLNSSSRAAVASMSSLQQHASGGEISTEPLLFKHDSYYPQSISMPTSGNAIAVSMKPDPRWNVFDE